MKKSHANGILAAALFVMGIFVFKAATANTQQAAAKIVPAANCTYTGNQYDRCYASDGEFNYIITHCTPGITTCGFNPE